MRIKGDIIGIELTSGETELEIDDHTGTMDVEYGAEIEDIKMGDEVVVEGKFYWNKIYAFAVKTSKQCLRWSRVQHQLPVRVQLPVLRLTKRQHLHLRQLKPGVDSTCLYTSS